jgi:hypothetical protein
VRPVEYACFSIFGIPEAVRALALAPNLFNISVVANACSKLLLSAFMAFYCTVLLFSWKEWSPDCKFSSKDCLTMTACLFNFEEILAPIYSMICYLELFAMLFLNSVLATIAPFPVS